MNLVTNLSILDCNQIPETVSSFCVQSYCISVVAKVSEVSGSTQNDLCCLLELKGPLFSALNPEMNYLRGLLMWRLSWKFILILKVVASKKTQVWVHLNI